MIAPFALNEEKAIAIWSNLAAIGCKLSGWSPEEERLAKQRNRRSPEFIQTWDTTPEQRQVLRQISADGAIVMGLDDGKHVAVLVQKYAPWPRDIYEQMTPIQQRKVTIDFLKMGGFADFVTCECGGRQKMTAENTLLACDKCGSTKQTE